MWEYASDTNPDQVYLSLILICGDSFVVRKEVQVCTHEKQAFGAFHFGKVSAKENIE